VCQCWRKGAVTGQQGGGENKRKQGRDKNKYKGGTLLSWPQLHEKICDSFIMQEISREATHILKYPAG
jgi:hypothetical protein